MKRLKSLVIFLVIVGGLFWLPSLVMAVDFSGDSCLKLLSELNLGTKKSYRPMGNVVSESGSVITCELGYRPDKEILDHYDKPEEILYENLSSGVWHGSLPGEENEYLSRCVNGQIRERVYYSDVNWRGRQTVTVELSVAPEIFDSTGACYDHKSQLPNSAQVAPPPNDDYCHNDDIVMAYFNYEDIRQADDRLLARVKAGEYEAENLRFELFEAQDMLVQANDCTIRCDCAEDPYLLMDAYNKWVRETGASKFGVGAIVVPTPSYDVEFDHEREVKEIEAEADKRDEDEAEAVAAAEHARALVENPPTPQDLILIPGVSSTVEFQKGFGVGAVKGEVKVLWPSGGDFRTPREGDVIQEGTEIRIERGARILLNQKGKEIIVEGPIKFRVEWGVEDLGEEWNEHFEILEGDGRIKFDHMDTKGFIQVEDRMFLLVGGKLIRLNGTDLGVSYDSDTGESIVELYDGEISVNDNQGTEEVVMKTEYGGEIKRVEVSEKGEITEKVGIPGSDWDDFQKLASKGRLLGIINGVVTILVIGGGIWWFKKRKKKK